MIMKKRKKTAQKGVLFPETLQEAVVYFNDPKVCYDFMVALRWPDGNVTCPKCGHDKVKYLRKRKIWQCKNVQDGWRHQFSVKTNSVLEESPISLSKWLVALWLISSAKNGISSLEISRALKLTQKTSWFLLHRIRLAMQTKSFARMSGELQADETYVGAPYENMHMARRKKARRNPSRYKAIVAGILHEDGEVRAEVMRDGKGKTLRGFIYENVKPESVMTTDASPAYGLLYEDYTHKIVDHSKEYMNKAGDHTNSIENFWSILKRGLQGTYISVEPFHLFRYVEETMFRFNSRKMKDGSRFVLACYGLFSKRLKYKALIGDHYDSSVRG